MIPVFKFYKDSFVASDRARAEVAANKSNIDAIVVEQLRDETQIFRNNASNSAQNADMSAQDAESFKNEANISADNASISAQNALLSENNALNFKNKAEEWAASPEDLPVEENKFSALHYAEKASKSSTEATTSAGIAITAKTQAETARDEAQDSAQESKDFAEASRIGNIIIFNDTPTTGLIEGQIYGVQTDEFIDIFLVGIGLETYFIQRIEILNDYGLLSEPVTTEQNNGLITEQAIQFNDYGLITGAI